MLEYKTQQWGSKMLPNRMIELVKNTGSMEQLGTGFYVDNEAEMLTVLAYLNYGETTNTTESLREQIDRAVKKLEAVDEGK